MKSVGIGKLPAHRWKDCRSLRLEALQSNPLAFGETYERAKASKEKTWKAHMKNAIFATQGDELVGMIVCYFEENPKFSHIAHIFSFYVRPGFRGKGIGKALLDNAILRARHDKGVVKVKLTVTSTQRAALALYKSAGFEVVARFDREMRMGGCFYAMLEMEKSLR